jgi:hypothetical protein
MMFKRGRLFVQQLLPVIFIGFGIHSANLAAEPNSRVFDARPLPVRRIFVPEKDLPLIGSEFLPIQAEELSRLIERSSDSLTSRAFDQPKLEQAIYVARLVGQDLVSYASRLSLTSTSGKSAKFAMQPCSLAIRPSNSPILAASSESQSATAPTDARLRSNLLGQTLIPCEGATEYWFGWSLKAQADVQPTSLTFAFDYPACIDNRLLLNLPVNWTIESASTVVSQLDDVSRYLGKTWGDMVVAEERSGIWWSFELSGSNHVTLKLTENSDVQKLSVDTLINQQALEYVIQPGTLEVRNRFELMNAVQEDTVQSVEIDDGLKISTVMLDESPVEWRLTPDGRRVEFQAISKSSLASVPDNNTLRRVEVKGIATWVDGATPQGLPRIRWPRSVTLQGQGNVQVRPPMRLGRVDAEPTSLEARPTFQLDSENSVSFTWQGELPKLQLQTASSLSEGRAQALTRLSNGTTGLEATTWIVLEPRIVDSTTLRLRLSAEWTLESIQATDRNQTITSMSATPTKSGELIFQIGDSRLLEVKTRSNWTFASESNPPTSVSFEGHRPIQLDGWEEASTFWIESTGRYKLEPTMDLLTRRTDPATIPNELRRRLPRINDLWVFTSTTERLPSLTMTRQPSPYRTQVETTVYPSLKGLLVRYRVGCTPLAGPVSSVVLDGTSLASRNVRWRQRTIKSASDETWVAVEARRQIEGGPMRQARQNTVAANIQLVLSKPASEAFELEGVIELPWTEQPNTSTPSCLIPLPWFPQAAQQDADLRIDDHLEIMSWNDGSPYTPAGHFQDGPVVNGRHYRYDAAQLTSLEVTPQPEGSAKAWLDPARSRLFVYHDGKQRLIIEGRMQGARGKTLTFQHPTDWRCRTIKYGTALIEMSPIQLNPNRTRFRLPANLEELNGIPIRLDFEGPTLDIDHSFNLQWPVFETADLVWDIDRELWLPHGFHVPVAGTSTLSKSIRPFSRQRFRFSNLWRNGETDGKPADDRSLDSELSVLDEELPKPSGQFHLAWSSRSTELESLASRLPANERSALTLTVGLDEAKQANRWLIVFGAFSIAICLAAISKRVVVGLWLLSLFFVGVAGLSSLEIAQAIAFGVSIAGLIVLIHQTFHSLKPIHDATFLQPPSHASRTQTRRQETAILLDGSKGLSLVLAFAAGLGWLSPLIASDTARSEQSESSYHVVVPVDGQGQISSSLVYVPEKLLQTLQSTIDQPLTSSEILSASYEFRLGNSSSQPAGQRLLAINYEIEVQDINQAIEFPLDAKQAIFVSMRVDGSDLLLGSRLRWNDQILAWSPSKKGLFKLEMVLQLIAAASSTAEESIFLDVIPVPQATATLELDSSTLTNIHAAGRVASLSMGRYEVDLGPVEHLEFGWRLGDRDLRSTLPSFNLECDVASFGGEFVARTALDFTNFPASMERLDIECDAAWQPISRDGGAATISDVLPAANGNRRRYRFRWDDLNSMKEEASLKTLTIFWQTSTSSSGFVSVPWLEIPSAKLLDAQLRFVNQNKSPWVLEGLRGWSRVETRDPPEWLPSATSSVETYSRSLGGAVPNLRRISLDESQMAKAQTSLFFDRATIRSRTDIEFEKSLNNNDSLNFIVPAQAYGLRVKSDDADVKFLIAFSPEGDQKLQILPQPSLRLRKNLTIEFEKSTATASSEVVPVAQWVQDQAYPHRVVAWRRLDERFEWEGIVEAPPTLSSATVGVIRTGRPLEINGTIEQRDGLANADAARPGTVSRADNRYRMAWAIELDSKTVDQWPKYRVETPAKAVRGRLLGQLSQGSLGWEYRLVGRLEAESASLDGVLFEVPTPLASSLRSRYSLVKLGTSESGYDLIYLLSGDGQSKTTFDFELTCPLPNTGEASTTSVPEIRWLGDIDWRAWVMVPRVIDAQEARWSWSNARTNDNRESLDFLPGDMIPRLDESIVLFLNSGRPQIRLNNLSSTNQPSLLVASLHHITASGAGEPLLTSEFWLSPRGKRSATIVFGQNFEWYAAECNGKSVASSLISQETTESADTKLSLKIPLASSTLPQALRIHFRLKNRLASETLAQSANYPTLEGTESDDIYLTAPASRRNVGDTILQTNQADSLNQLLTAILDVCERSNSLIAEVPSRERNQWWSGWQACNRNLWKSSLIELSTDQWTTMSQRYHDFCNRQALPSTMFSSMQEMVAISQSVAADRKFFRFARSSKEPLVAESKKGWSKPRFEVGDGPSIITLVFGSLVWFVVARWLIRAYPGWSHNLRRFLQCRPWWLWIALGFIAWFWFPTSWLAPGMTTVGLFLTVRSYILYRHLRRPAWF